MEQTTPTVTVIIPSYNCAQYIGQTLESVLRQTVCPTEILVIDDGSTDNTKAVVESFRERCPQLRLISNDKNKGVSYSRNKGVSLAGGEWVAFLDSDDLWRHDKLEKQLAFLQEQKAVFTFTGSSYIDECGEFYSGLLEVPFTVNRKTLLRQNVISCSSVVIKRELIARYPMKSDDIHEDFDTWLRILEEVPVAYGLNEPLLVYRLSRNSKSGNKVKSFYMNYKTYRAAGLNPISSAVNMVWYTKNGLKKYRTIKGSPKTRNGR